MTGHIISGYVFLINEDVFNSLTEQAAVQQAGKDAAVFMRNRAMEKWMRLQRSLGMNMV